MTKIKFRLIKNGKIVGYEEHIVCKEDDECREEHKGEIRIQHYDKWGKSIGKGYIIHENKDQYIGLLAEKGTEIYERDVVATEMDGEGVWIGGIITYYYGKWIITNGNGYAIDEESDVFEYWNTKENKTSLLSMGNIHKNPELVGIIRKMWEG